jgi:hypothetical protein
MHRLNLSSRIKWILFAVIVLAAGIGIWQAILYFVPPPKGEQCQAAAETANESAQLIPAETSASPTPAPSANITEATEQATPAAALSPLLQYSRSGFGLADSANASLWAGQLGASWYLDWDVQPISSKNTPNHWQMVRLKPGCIYPSNEYIKWAARRYPGNVWVIGNEPDVALQDNLTPEEYAQDYHKLYTLIKTADRTASIAVGGVAQATPLRLEYLDRVLAYYKKTYGSSLPADWWTLHSYVLPEKRGSWGVGIPPGLTEDEGELYAIEEHGRLDLFKQHIADFRTWMAKNGYRETPLAVTEFGLLLPEIYGYSQFSAAKYLTATVKWLDSAKDTQIGLPNDSNRLVQKWAWFSLSDPYFSNSDLVFLNSDSLTLIGQAYREYNQIAGQ